MKKLLNIILVMIMMFTVLPVNAATGTGSITINKSKTQNDVNYDLYRIFDVEYDSTNKTQVYFLNDTYKDLFTTGVLKDYITTSTNPSNEGRTYVKTTTFEDEASTKAFTKAALAAIKAAGISVDATMKIAKNDTTGTVEGLTYGYWLVDSSLGANVTLDTTKPNATINDKNEDTIPEKTVAETSAQITEDLHYTVDFEIKAGAQNLVFSDVMTKGLTYAEEYKVVLVDKTTEEETKVNAENYTYTVGTLVANGNDFQFKIAFNNDFATANEGKVIRITYTATVNEEALTVDTVNNTAIYNYGDNNTVESNTIETPLYRFGIDKVDDVDQSKKLAGAGFKLYSRGANGNLTEVKVHQVTADNGKIYYVPTTNEVGEVIVTDENGYAEVRGLANGSYEVEEVQAPQDYVKLTKNVSVNVEQQDDGAKTKVTTLSTVVNTKSVVLPSTGGMGTVMFVLVGSIMAIGMGVMLVTKFRMSKELA